MNHRERWTGTMHFQPVDHIADQEFGYWEETLARWRGEGMPAEVIDWPSADTYFGYSPLRLAPVAGHLFPPIEEKVIEEGDEYRIIINGDGVKCRVRKDFRYSGMPEFLEYPVRDRQTWENLAPLWVASDPARYPADWEEQKKEWQTRDYHMGIHIGSLFGFWRNMSGLEWACTLCYRDPVLFEEIVEQQFTFHMAVTRRAIEEVAFDYAAIWEDMACRTGPFLPPAIFREFLVPRYARMTAMLREHGVDVVYVDCDGNIDLLIEPWLEAGVNCMIPLEVAAGADPVKYREKYGHRVLLMGGVDKAPLIQFDKNGIRKMIERLAPVVEDGGYIPHLDHLCPPDISFESYRYYLACKRDRFGIPEPAPYKERRLLALAIT